MSTMDKQAARLDAQQQLAELDGMDHVKQICNGAFLVIAVPTEATYAIGVLENMQGDWYDVSGYRDADVTADEADPLELVYKDRVYWFEHSANFGCGVASMIGKKVGEKVLEDGCYYTRYYQGVIADG